ncbi:MurR/RpiR family transcriptional regulator [Pseudorhodobacter turbinis]|uniref:MurR/RpiR family transcriptional regulator n=1 Tax=Pseudorhodobacter turbinis TaxID=2500533 RepID=UPI00143D12C4|nr:MurR/RpiR family transcriptional regulator [Pseudorhodobacter turbinis]
MKKKDERPINANRKSPDTPPTNIEELRTLLIDITKGDAPHSLGAKARAAFGRILDIQDSNDLLSITTLSERIETNPSTITRLAKNLGYPGFGAFQKALLATRLQQPGSFYLNQAQSALLNADQPIKQRAAQLCHENQANIDHFVENLDPKSFETAIRLIADARRVTIYGIRQFHSLAAFLAYGLRLIRADVSVLDSNALGAAEEIGAMGAGDVCIVISVAPYSRQVVAAAQVAHEQGLDVIAITDLASSPLVSTSKAAIFAPHQSSFISNSITSFFAVAECVINAVAASNSEETEQALIARQNLIKRLNVEDR